MKITIGKKDQIKESIVSTIDDLKNILAKIIKDDNDFYIIIESGKNNYCQCAGSEGAYTVEVRVPFRDEFRHWRLGYKNQSRIWTEINCFVGPIAVLEHEIMSFMDTTRFIEQFFLKGETDDFIKNQRESYNLRNITRTFW